MNGPARRNALLQRLQDAPRPVSAAVLAQEFHVSRQIIVSDVALLRAAGHAISATPRGYRLENLPGITCTLACVHPPEGMRAELEALVDAGCEVVDVIVEHPVYGQLTGALCLRSRYDVNRFVEKIQQSDARPLAELTGGIHLHTIRGPNCETLERGIAALRALHCLLDDPEP